MPETKIQRAETNRDMKSQLIVNQGLDRDEASGIIFKETSPARVKTTIYHVRNGQPAEVPEYIAIKALNKIELETGEYMFTAHGFSCECGNCTPESRAPEYKQGAILCFLHEESPDQPVLEELGLANIRCRKRTLANMHSKRMHAQHRHKDEWDAYQALLDERKEARAEERSEEQIAAMLSVANRAVDGPVLEKSRTKTATCNSCGAEIEGKLADHTC